MTEPAHRVVIVGGGFGGLYTAKALKNAPVEVTLIDKRNFHLFQPLLYQVATATVSPADIASPLRLVLRGHRNTTVLLDEVSDIDPAAKTVQLRDRALPYDTLIVATGVSHHYFGNERWQVHAPGLKTIEDALEIRRRIFKAFEEAEKESDPDKRRAWLTFAIVGGGPTGVELAGAIADIAHSAITKDFQQIDTTTAQILLLEGLDRVLPPYHPELSERAARDLAKLGVTVRTQTMVTSVAEGAIALRHGDEEEIVAAQTILWAAGVKASALGKVLQERAGAELDRAGRVVVEPDLSLPNYPNILIVGDLANFPHQGELPLPGIAPVAMQQGQYAARLIQQRWRGEVLPPFRYVHFGNLAVIGQNAAVVDLGFWRLTGFPAWLIWVFAHIYYLIEFDNKLVVMMQWGWNYFTRGRGARLITGDRAPFVQAPEAADAAEVTAERG